MGSQRLRPLPWGMTAKAWWVLPQGTLTDAPSAVEVAPWRPWLSIDWREGKTLALALMNPSAATAEQLDATVRNALYFALRLDIDGVPVGRLVVVNAFDVRATTLDVVAGRAEVQLEQEGERVTLGEGLPLVSEHCDRFIQEAAEAADLVVCGWGAKVGPERTAELLAGPLAGAALHAWRLSADGSFPLHPRGQAKDLLPSRWLDGQLLADRRLSLRGEASLPSRSLRGMRRGAWTCIEGTLASHERESAWRWL